MAKDGGHLEIDTETKWESWLHKLAFRGDAEAVEVFLTRAPTLLGCRDSNGETPAHWAAKYGHLSVLQVLRKHGADLTTTDNADNTPARLIVADMSGAPEAVRFVTEACGAEALEAPKEEEEEEEDECAAFQRAESARQEQEMNARINASIQKSRQRTMDSMSEQRAFTSTLPADCSMRASLEDQHRTLRGMMGYHSMFEQMLAPSGSAPQALGGSNPFGSGPVPQTSRAGFAASGAAEPVAGRRVRALLWSRLRTRRRLRRQKGNASSTRLRRRARVSRRRSAGRSGSDVSDNPLALLFEGGEERAVPAKLAALHVSGTALATLPAALFRLSDFRTLTLTGTPLATSLLKVDGYEEWAKKQR